MENEPKEVRAKNKKWQDKPLTPLQVLKKRPKAMQVGPQPELRKNWMKANEEKK